MRNFSLLVATVAFSISAPLFGQEAKPVAVAPAYVIGEQWRYQHETKTSHTPPAEWVERVERASDKEVWIMRTRGTQRSWRLIDGQSGGLKGEFAYDETSSNQVGLLRSEHLPIAAVTQFPLEVGKSYPVFQKWLNSQGSRGTSDLKAKVTAFEKIKFNNGEIDSYRVDLAGWWNNSGGGSGKMEISAWYAPAIKQIVRWEHKDFSAGFLSNHTITSVVEFKPAQ